MSKFHDTEVGVLAIQGDFERHIHQLRLVGASPIEVRLPADLDQLEALIIPGGESTTIHYLVDKYHLREPLERFCGKRPVWGTCAGMIMLATGIENNQSGVVPLNTLDIDVVRNGYGRQVYSIDEAVPACLDGAQEVLRATFIRAPRIVRLGDGIDVLARYRDDPVLIRHGATMASAFHTELDDDTRLLEYFLGRVAAIPEAR